MNNLQKYILTQNNSLIDSLLVKVIHSTYIFEFSETTSKENLTDSFIEKNKIKFIITGDNQIYYISDSEGTKEYIEKDKTFFNDFAFFEVKNNIVNNVNILETSPQAIIKTEVENQDIQNITVIKNTDLKPDLSLKKDSINIYSLFDYKDVCILAIARKLLQNEIKVDDNEYRFDCFTNHKKNLTSKEKVKLRVFKDTQSFKCFDCGVKGNNVQLVIDVLNYDSMEAIKWLKENFYYSNSNYSFIPSGTLKQSEPEPTTQIPKIQCRIIKKDSEPRYIWFYPNQIQKIEITQTIIDDINKELNKNYSLDTFKLLQDFAFIGTYKNNNYICFKHNTELKNIVFNNNARVNIICEGRTDFLTIVELFKNNISDVNIISRYNVKNHIDFNLTNINIFILDNDNTITELEKLLNDSQQSNFDVKIFTVEFKQFIPEYGKKLNDISDYHFLISNFDTSKTKEYLKNNKKEFKKEYKSLFSNNLITQEELDKMQNMKFLVNEFIPIGGVVMFFANGGVGKSTLISRLMYQVSIEKKTRVLYLDKDNSKRIYQIRKMLSTDYFELIACNDLNNDVIFINLEKTLQSNVKENFVIVFDSLKNFCNEQVKDKEVMMFMQKIRDLTAKYTNATIILLHHTNKQNELKGNNSFRDSVDIAYRIESNFDKEKNILWVKTSTDKDKFGVVAKNFKIDLSIDSVNGGVTVLSDNEVVAISELEKLECEVIDFIKSKNENITASEIREYLKTEKKVNANETINKVLRGVEKNPQIDNSKVGTTKYFFTNKNY